MNKLSTRCHKWAFDHIRAFRQAFRHPAQSPWMTVLTLLMITIALTLPATLYVTTQNVTVWGQHWHQTPALSVYLKPGTPSHTVNEVRAKLATNPHTLSTTYITPHKGYKELMRNTTLQPLAQQLSPKQVPGLITVTLSDDPLTAIALQSWLNTINHWESTQFVQVNLTWIQRLQTILSFGQRLLVALSIILGVAVVATMNHTLYLSAKQQSDEITLLKLIGANHAMIRRPFLYQGAFTGLVSGLLAWALVDCTLWWLSQPLAQLAHTYQMTLSLHTLGFYGGFSLTLIAVGLGALAAILSSHNLLKKEEFIQF